MLPQAIVVSTAKPAVSALALLAFCCAAIAQAGAGGGHVGGGNAGGGRLGGAGGGATAGVDLKDDLKGFHAALALQATQPQIVAYSAMMNATDAATAELRAFINQLSKQGSASGLAARSTSLDQAFEQARASNRKFIDDFSEPQKSGLKEISRRLLKDDSDLAQQTKTLSLAVADVKATPQSFVPLAETLDRTLETFRKEQIDLGAEMSIAPGTEGTGSVFHLTPVPRSVFYGDQPVTVTTTRIISKAGSSPGVFTIELASDFSDVQQNITAAMRNALNKSDRCGERVEIQSATLLPEPPAARVTLQLHYERWFCPGGAMNEMAEGNGTMEVKLTPSIAEDGTLRLASEPGRIHAEGVLGDALRSGSLGDTLREKIADPLLAAVKQSADFNTILPISAQGHARLTRAQFQGTGLNRLAVDLEGEIKLSSEAATLLSSELKGTRPSSETSRPPKSQ